MIKTMDYMDSFDMIISLKKIKKLSFRYIEIEYQKLAKLKAYLLCSILENRYCQLGLAGDYLCVVLSHFAHTVVYTQCK